MMFLSRRWPCPACHRGFAQYYRSSAAPPTEEGKDAEERMVPSLTPNQHIPRKQFAEIEFPKAHTPTSKCFLASSLPTFAIASCSAVIASSSSTIFMYALERSRNWRIVFSFWLSWSSYLKKHPIGQGRVTSSATARCTDTYGVNVSPSVHFLLCKLRSIFSSSSFLR